MHFISILLNKYKYKYSLISHALVIASLMLSFILNSKHFFFFKIDIHTVKTSINLSTPVHPATETQSDQMQSVETSFDDAANDVNLDLVSCSKIYISEVFNHLSMKYFY